MNQERFVLSVTWSSRLIFLILEVNEKVYVKLGINSVSSSVMNVAYDDEGKSTNGNIDEEISFICGKILNMVVTKDNWMNLEIYIHFDSWWNVSKRYRSDIEDQYDGMTSSFEIIFVFDDLYVVSYWDLSSCLDLCAILLDFFFTQSSFEHSWGLFDSEVNVSLCDSLNLIWWVSDSFRYPSKSHCRVIHLWSIVDTFTLRDCRLYAFRYIHRHPSSS